MKFADQKSKVEESATVVNKGKIDNTFITDILQPSYIYATIKTVNRSIIYCLFIIQNKIWIGQYFF